MNISFHLYQLQKIDSQISESKQRLSAIAVAMESSAEMKQVKQAREEESNHLKIEKQALYIINSEVDAKKIKIEQCESSLYGGTVKNPKELQDLQVESAMLFKQLTALEESQLEKMISVEEAEKAYQQVLYEFQTVETKFFTGYALLTSEKENLEQKIKRLEVERKAIVEQLPVATLDRYEKLRTAKHGIAVAALQDNSCSVCGTTFAPSQSQAARSQTEIFYCPTCQRIIFGG